MLLVIILIIPYFLFGFCSRRIHIMTKDKSITKLQKNKNKKL